MEYNVVSHAKKVGAASDAVCTLARQLGAKAFADAIRRGSDNLMCLIDELEPAHPRIPESARQAIRAYVVASEYIDTKRQLAINLLTGPKFSAVSTTDSIAASVIRSIGLHQPLPADRILQPLVVKEGSKFDSYEMKFSYLDDSEMLDISWDAFHQWYSAGSYVDGQLAARCLISPVALPVEVSNILSEIRMCYAFGQMTAVHGLCRGLIEAAITDVCVRIGVITKRELQDEYFFKNFSPAKRINRVLRGSDRSEAFSLYTTTSRVVHGSKAPENAREVIRRSIELVENIYSRYSRQLASNT